MDLAVTCPICKRFPGSMCAPAGRVGADRWVPHAARVVLAQVTRTMIAVAARSRGARPTTITKE